MPGGFHPSEVLSSFRRLNPGKFDEFSDADLLDSIKRLDPGTYGLIDQDLQGAEILGQSLREMPAAPQRQIPTQPVTPSTFDTLATTGLRLAPPLLAGGAAAMLTKSPAAVAGASAAATGLGETAAQYYEKTFGARDAINPYVIAGESALGAINPAARGSSMLARTASQVGYGATLGAGESVLRTGLEEGRLPTAGEVGTQALAGGVLGGAIHAGFEGVGAVARHAPEFGDLTGGLPMDGGPPPQPIDQLAMHAASTAQYQAEEGRLAQQLSAVFGPDARPARSADLHTAVQAKDYLQQLADLQQQPIPVPDIQPGLSRPAPGPGQGLLPAAAGPDARPPIIAYPPGQDPNLELVGSLAPPASRVIGGTDVGAVQPPPTFEGALESSLQAQPGPPRLVRPLALSSLEPGVSRGIDGAPPLLERPLQTFDAPIEQGARMGGKKATETQPRIPGTDQPAPLDNRPYATGPNAGPRRKAEPHGAPRMVRRQVRAGKKISYEQVASTAHAEDPGTYPPEVRRELAAMAWELDQFRHEKHAGNLRGQGDSEIIAASRKSGVSKGGSTPGAPVYHDIIGKAEGNFAHVTRANMLKQVRAALLEGKGTGLTDAAAAVARTRIAQRAAGRGALLEPHNILAQRGDEGDALISWIDHNGEQALPDQDLDEFARAVRDADDGEILSSLRILDESGDHIGEDVLPYFAAAKDEAVRRGLIRPEQGDLTMGGPGGDKGPSLLDFEGGPPPEKPDALQAQRNAAAKAEAAGAPPAYTSAEWVAEGRDLERRVREGGAPEAVQPPAPREAPRQRTGMEEFEPALPELEGVRSESRPTPPVADVPFALTPPPAKPALGTRKGAELPGLFDRLKGEEGVLILDIPAGDRTGLKKWLKAQEDEHGGTAWFARVEHHIEAGDWDKAWKAAASASVSSYARAYRDAKDPASHARLTQAIRGTPLQSDLNTEIVGGARARAGVGEAPPVKDFPPSRRATQAGAARGTATIGPAGILNPGPRQRPLSSAAPTLRAGTLDREVVRLVMEGIDEVEGLATVPGNTDTYLRLFRQVGDQIYKGQNLKLLRDAGVKIPPEELAQHWNATISDAGRTLQLMSSFAQAHREVLTEAAEAMSMGGAVRGMLGGGRPPVYTGARGRVATPGGQRATQEVIDQIAERTSQYQATAMANDLQKRAAVGPLRALHDASYSWMLSKWNTAVRNYVSFTGRYGVDSLDHALTIPIARLAGDEPTATLSKALLQERGLQPMGRAGTAVTPQRAWSDDLQGIYDFTTDNLTRLKPNDARQAIKLLLDAPESMAHYLGTTAGEDLSQEFSNTPVIRHLVNPKVQRVLTMFNRAQEFSARAVVFDATTRALVRAKGLDPNVVLTQPTPAIIQALGGQQAFEDVMFTATAQALEGTFAGRTSKDSIPGALIRFINEAWPLKLGMPFPRFNISAAPRWIYDHSPAALLDLARFPLDRAGITAPRGTVGGGRLYRGVRAQEIMRDELPALQLKIGQAEKAQGTALQELLGTQREFAIRQRQVTRLGTRAQPAMPGVDPLGEATTALDQLARRRERLKSQVAEHKGIVTDLKSEQKKLLGRVVDATGINAPNYAQYLARMGTGTVGMLGAAWVVRAQEAAQGTRWYEYKVDREGKDPVILDFRPFAPFAQYLFVADVMQDFQQHTDWAKVKSDTLTEEEGVLASPLEWSHAIWNNYEGKYTEAELGAQFAQAFLSISRAAGTTLTLADLLTQNGWPTLEDASRAVVGTIGQYLSRFTVPGQQISDLITAPLSSEEAKVRTPPKATMEDWERPLAGPIANVPFAKQLIPESVSQMTGKPVQTEYPLLRGLAGIGTTPRDFVTEEVRRIGVPGQSVFIRETGDYALDRTIAEAYAKVLEEELPAVLEAPEYQQLGTPARQRDYMQRYIFPALKRAALGEARQTVGETAYQGATVTGENARRQTRQLQLLEALEGAEPGAPAEEQVGTPPPQAPAAIGAGGPPPGPF